MYRGKRLKAKAGFGYQPKRLRRPGKYLMKTSRPAGTGKLLRCTAAAAALCTLAFTGAADLSTAYLHDQDSVNNAFILGSVTPFIHEDFNKESRVKQNVTIRNDGNTPVYIRALWIISWKDAEDRSVLSPAPMEGTDYDFTGPETGEWIRGSDSYYYYYTKPVQPGGETARLIQSLTDKNDDPKRQLCVDVIAQAVQARPAQAVGEVFPNMIVKEDGTLALKPATTSEEAAP